MKYTREIDYILEHARDVEVDAYGIGRWMVEPGYTMEETWPFSSRLQASIEFYVHRHPEFFLRIKLKDFCDALYNKLSPEEEACYQYKLTLGCILKVLGYLNDEAS